MNFGVVGAVLWDWDSDWGSGMGIEVMGSELGWDRD